MTVITSTECAAQSDVNFCRNTSHGKQKNLGNFLWSPLFLRGINLWIHSSNSRK